MSLFSVTYDVLGLNDAPEDLKSINLRFQHHVYVGNSVSPLVAIWLFSGVLGVNLQFQNMFYDIIDFIIYCEAQASVRQGWARDGPQGKRP